VELAVWAERDPIDRLGRLLRATGTLTEEVEAGIASMADAAAAEVRAGCLALEDPDPLALFDHVYAEPHPVIERERAEFARYLDGFVEAVRS
jgi:pyruvate dehydrogenase E1 component alpha subunit